LLQVAGDSWQSLDTAELVALMAISTSDGDINE
jgi:hypothetical protein